MLGTYTTEKIWLHRNLVGEQHSLVSLWLWGPALEARPMSWPLVVADLETKPTTAGPDSPALLSKGDPCSTSETDRKPPRGLQGTWLSQGPTQVSELIPAH